MADITVTTDFSQVNQLNAAIDKTSVIFAKTVATIVREQRSMERAIKASATVQEEAVTRLSSKMSKDTQDWLASQRRKLSMMAESEKMAQKQAAAEAKLTAELARQRIEAERAGSARSPIQQRIASSTGMGGQPATSQGAGFSGMEAEIERLRMKYDQVYASSNLYEKSLAELSRAHMLGVTSTKQHEAAVESLNLEYQNFQNGIAQAGNRFSQYSAQSASRMGQFGVVTQQAGYQIGDFLVQIQSGTNWMVAFGQQATQLVGVLPLMGAGFLGLSTGALVALSAGLGIAIPLVTAIGAAFMRTSEDAKSSSGGIDTFSGAIQRLTAEIQTNQETFLKAKFDTESSGVAGASQQIEDLRKQIPLVRAELDAFYMAVAQSGGISLGALFGDEGDTLKENLESLENQLFTLEAQAEAQRMLNGHMSVSATYQKGIVEGLLEQKRASEDAAKSAEFTANYISLIAERALDAAEASQQINFSSAVSSAAALAEQLGISVGLASKIMSMGFGQKKSVVLDPRDPNYNPIAAEMEKIKGEYGRVSPFDPSRMATSSGGGGGSSARLKEEINLTVKLTEVEKERQSIVETVNGTLEDGFVDMVKGTKTVGEAFRSMAAAIIEELFRVLVVQRLVGGITGALTGGAGGFTNAQAGRLTGGGRASGGSMMAGGSYLVGENGPEIVVPRHSGTVINANQTSGAMAGSGGITVQNNITVTGSDAAMVRQEVAKMIPQITNATKAAVIDAKQRGGQMGAAFR
jgi:hypothetical protein